MRRACERPMPRPLPVTTATFPSSICSGMPVPPLGGCCGRHPRDGPEHERPDGGSGSGRPIPPEDEER